MSKFWENLSENERVYEFYGSDSLMSFNGETDEEDEKWNEMTKHGDQMRADAEKTPMNVIKLLEEIVLEHLEEHPLSIHSITDEIKYGRHKDEVYNAKWEEVEQVLFFKTLPGLLGKKMIRMMGVRRLGGGYEYIYFMK